MDTSDVAVLHPWPRRMLRSVQFGLLSLRGRKGYVDARSAPFDLSFTGPVADCITRHIYRLGSHEPVITRHLVTHVHLGPGDVALDVGANLGWYSVLLDRLSEPGARILAFEPDPESYRLLERNLLANKAGRVTPLNIALGEVAGEAVLHRYKDANNGRHTLCDDGDSSGGTVTVPVRTLKDVWNEHGLDGKRVRFLKIDVEGFEYFVLRGAADLLKRCDCVQLEYNPPSRPDGTRDLLALLEAAGLGARAFAGDELVPISYAELATVTTQRDLMLAPA